MKATYLLVAFLALASFASAYDPSPLQDFCVALPDGIKDAVFVNGKFCKDPKVVVAEDFFKHVDPGNVVNKLGSKVTPVTVNELAGLNTLGISLARIDFGPKGLNPPHTHPRATEILIVIEGTLLVGFVTSNQNNTNRLFTKVLNKGDVFVFPIGLIHFQSNIGYGNAFAIAGLSSQNPGVITIANAVFGSTPPISPEILAKAFQVDNNTRCAVDEQFVPKVGMIFKRLEEAGKFYKYYSKLASFSTKIRNTTRDGDKIKNQLIVCSREGRWKSKISPTLKTNPSAGINCPARIYVHILKDVGLWTISKVVLNHSHPCCPDRAEMLKQHRELSMFVCRTIETNEEAKIRPSKTYQSFIAVAGSHWELSFIEKDVRNYITREVRNVSEQDDAKEFRKYLLRMKENNQNLFFELNLEGDHSIKHAFWADTRSRAACEYFGDVVSFNTTYNTNRNI
ncbi:hypothetical protein Ahy_B06g081358 isoform B [Arachis hypogaea]|uniref:Cupin type-1 domain-containing protein n=1 Tax=Arachis hypogaea TaxID=3818 RepID=A0A444YKU5_ARAHY|nr:hypothetical protein Ahy_B06g081358 isoform B [Arachis hypogaea]